MTLPSPLIVIASYDKQAWILSKLRQKNPFQAIKIYSRDEFVALYRPALNPQIVERLLTQTDLTFGFIEQVSPCLVNLPHLPASFPMLETLKTVLSNLPLIDDNPLVRLIKYEDQEIILVDYPLSTDPVLQQIIEAHHLKVVAISKKAEWQPQNVRQFPTLSAELDALFNQIMALNKGGVALNDIFLLLPPSIRDSFTFINLLVLYKIPFNNLPGSSLRTLPIFSFFLENFRRNEKIADHYRRLEGEYAKYSAPEIALLFRLWNDYTLPDAVSYKRQVAYYQHGARGLYLPSPHYAQGVTILDDYPILENKHLFIVGFSASEYPKSHQSSILNDDILSANGLLRPGDLNRREQELLHTFVRQPNTYYFSYHALNAGETVYPSPLIEEWGWEIDPTPFSYSHLAELPFRIQAYKEYEKGQQYGYSTKFDTLIDRRLYAAYDNQFRPFAFRQDLPPISYSLLDTYNKCPFNYYVQSVLKLKKEPRDDFALRLGNLLHQVIEKVISQDLSFTAALTLATKDFEYRDLLEPLLVEPLTIELELFTTHMQKFLQEIPQFQAMVERTLFVHMPGDIEIKGRIDCLLFDRQAGHGVLIDFKSGGETIDPSLFPFGLSLQLPFYMFLLSEDLSYINTRLIGAYIWPLTLPKSRQLLSETEVSKAVRFQGLTRDDPSLIRTLFPDFLSHNVSSHIRGIAFKKDGELDSRSKGHLLSEKQANEYIEIVRNSIENFVKNLRLSHFEIAPLKIEKVTKTGTINQYFDSCTYCENRDLCFKKEADYRHKRLVNTTDKLESESQ